MNTFPPWIRDEHPEYWVLLNVAAQFYFHKSRSAVKQMIKDGRLEAAGIMSYWDGTRWHLRIPELITHRHLSKTA